MSIETPDNGTAVPTSTPTTGIDEFAMKHDNTRNPEPPLDPVANAGPGKDQG